jgi:hypothetical protein
MNLTLGQVSPPPTEAFAEVFGSFGNGDPVFLDYSLWFSSERFLGCLHHLQLLPRGFLNRISALFLFEDLALRRNLQK